MKAAPPIVTFTPSAMDPELLETIFVEREPLAKRVLSSIKKSIASAAKHHWLLVGPRGIGKTHFVSLIYYRLLRDSRLKNRVRVAWLREESWEVASYADFLDAVLRSLATEYNDSQLAEEHDALLDLSEHEAERAAEELLLEAIGDRTLLLIVENLDEVFHGLGTAGQRSLRAFIENTDRCVLLATTTTLFPGVSNHSSPFFGFFTVNHLEELDLSSAKELLARVAELRSDAKLVKFLTTPTADARLRVIQELAGGHPRIWILFANCISVELIDELVPLFIKMLDDLTPYYQERLRSLPPQQRRIAIHLATIRGAQPVKEIARAVRLSQQSAAKLLGDLETKGFTRRAGGFPTTSTGDRRLTAYELREPLMRLSLEIKESRGKPLRLIVAFLRDWFARDLETLLDEVEPTSLAGQYLQEALDSYVQRVEHLKESPYPLLGLLVLWMIATTVRTRKGNFHVELVDGFQAEELLQAVTKFLEEHAPPTGIATALGNTAFLLVNNSMFSALLGIADMPSELRDHLATTDRRVGSELWLQHWKRVAATNENYSTAVRLLEAGINWRRDRNRKHLLELPSEEREILRRMIDFEWKAAPN